MIAAEVQFYDVVVFLHILAVVLAFGPTFAYGLFFATAARMNPAALPAVGQAVVTWGRTAQRLSDFFVSWGLAAILILLALSEAYFIPTTKRFIAAAEGGRQEEVQAIAKQQGTMGPIAGLIVILTIYVMTAKPFL
jgi:hypothetical protein